MKQGVIVSVSSKDPNVIAVKEEKGPLMMVTMENEIGIDYKKFIGTCIKYYVFRREDGSRGISII